MTREQIEAWLTLEGWHFHPRNHPHCDHAWKDCGGGGPLVTLHQGEKPTYHAGHHYVQGRVSDFSKATDEQLQLIYQEIIKHEKD